jgi:sterol O-acyltransferase
MAFLISALFHEVIVTCGLGFFFPILFIMFGGPGVILTKVRFGKGVYAGTFFWFLMLIGSGMLMVLICREFYARQSPEAATFMKDGLLAVLYPQSIRFMIERK